MDLKCQGSTIDGVYTISIPGTNKFQLIYCEMNAGGWTRIQRREDGTINFNADWTASAQGFGNTATEHYLGKNFHFNIMMFYKTSFISYYY